MTEWLRKHDNEWRSKEEVLNSSARRKSISWVEVFSFNRYNIILKTILIKLTTKLTQLTQKLTLKSKLKKTKTKPGLRFLTYGDGNRGFSSVELKKTA